MIGVSAKGKGQVPPCDGSDRSVSKTVPSVSAWLNVDGRFLP
jgi:hypothetical protein